MKLSLLFLGIFLGTQTHASDSFSCYFNSQGLIWKEYGTYTSFSFDQVIDGVKISGKGYVEERNDVDLGHIEFQAMDDAGNIVFDGTGGFSTYRSLKIRILLNNKETSLVCSF